MKKTHTHTQLSNIAEAAVTVALSDKQTKQKSITKNWNWIQNMNRIVHRSIEFNFACKQQQQQSAHWKQNGCVCVLACLRLSVAQWKWQFVRVRALFLRFDLMPENLHAQIDPRTFTLTHRDRMCTALKMKIGNRRVATDLITKLKSNRENRDVCAYGFSKAFQKSLDIIINRY